MEVRTLGRLRKFGDVAAGSVQGPPSSQAVVGLLRREPGSLGRVFMSTALRGLLLAPGAGLAGYIGGARGWRLAGATAAGAGLGSLGITLFLLGYYMLKGTQGEPTSTGTAAGSTPMPGDQTQGPPQGQAQVVDPSTLWGGQSMDPRTLSQIQASTTRSDVAEASVAQIDSTMPSLQGLGGRSFRGHGTSGTGW